jgi:hypothetical protein
MRRFTLLIGTAIALTALGTSVNAAGIHVVSEGAVKSACKGRKITSGDGAWGCTVASTDGSGPQDWGCNSNPKNGPVGCSVLSKKAPKPGKGQITTESGAFSLEATAIKRLV